MNKASIRPFSEPWLMGTVLITSLAAALFFQQAWRYPMVDSFPLIERLIDPSFLTNDFYTNTFNVYSPRLHLAQLIVALTHITQVDYMQLIAWLNIVRIFVFGLAVYWLYSGLERDQRVALLAFFLSMISFLSVPNLLAWWPVSYDFTAANFAIVFTWLSWGAIVRGRAVGALLLISIATYYHPLVGILGLLIATLLFVSKFGISGILNQFLRPWVLLSLVLLAAAFWSNYGPYEKILDDKTFLSINVFFRHPHHFLLSYVSWTKWFGFVIYWSMLAYILTRKKIPYPKSPYTIPVVFYALLMLVANLFFVELYPTRTMASLIPLRAFPILVPIFVLGYSRYMLEKFDQQQNVLFILLMLPFIPFAHIGLTWYFLPGYDALILPLAVFALVSAAAISIDLWGNFLDPLDQLISALFEPNMLRKLGVAASLTFLALSISSFRFNLPSNANRAPIYAWLSTHTDQRDIILAELNAADNQVLRILSRRAIIVSKDFPFAERYYKTWYRRYHDVYDSRDTARGRIDNLDETSLARMMRKYGATVLLRTKPIASPQFFELIGRTMGEKGPVLVYRIGGTPRE